ncbi:MAG: bifunctional tRNA (5-methylaminomethyl-2-thiouridine)(34)-methyltransferase MnmD/FAD-dependent 5-carboxymethylaminomethyl-2-thiouridine(34) oxidoreductase MnmC [Alphaproteobacteria bacterium]|nr:bifunctional tRNA (5-methylaminomethyl-2-thiouridine)(34)-methyltransferase MnmD/FAD-dependent 5-carboxymethylaminomethyl-2-thiouridine(34) oxidoreductase MnmC [Alphaproteobacteria bacterium]
MTLKPARLQWSENGDLESLDYGDVYFQRGAGFAESDYVFLRHSNLAARFNALGAESFHIGELGFGSGMNFLLSAALFLANAPQAAQLVYVSIEKHPIPPEMLAQIYAQWPQHADIGAQITAQYPPLIEGFHTLILAGGRIRLMLCFGDVADMLPQIDGDFDAWFLDGFSPAKNPDMWREDLFPAIAVRTKPQGTLATFSVAGHMRRALKMLGFEVRKVKGFGIKWSMTAAQKTGDACTAQRRRHIAVLGGGIAGCSAAYALARRGHRVTLIDRQKDVAQETSGNPVGIVYPKITIDPSRVGKLHAHGFCYTRMLCTALPLASWKPCGVTHIDKDAEDAERHRRQVEGNSLPPEYALYSAAGLHLPLAGYLCPPDFCAALSTHPLIKTVFVQTAAILEKDGASWRVLEADQSLLCLADNVVIALGNQSKDLPQTSWLPLQSLRGQISYIRPTATSAALEGVICHDGYICPPVNGIQYIGATFQKEPAAVPDLRIEDDAENVEKLAQHLPQLNIKTEDVIGARAGYRAATPDRLPIAGPAPDAPAVLAAFADLRYRAATDPRPLPLIDGLYISTGFGAHGMASAPLCGEVIAAMISREPLPVPRDLAAALAPARFLLRDLKRGKA